MHTYDVVGNGEGQAIARGLVRKSAEEAAGWREALQEKYVRSTNAKLHTYFVCSKCTTCI